MTKKHATYYTDADTRQSLIDIGMKAGAKEGRAASLGLRISAAYHERMQEALETATLGLEAMIEEGKCGHMFTAVALAVDTNRALLAEIEDSKK